MKTTFTVKEANCPTCFEVALDALGAIDGVNAVHGSVAGPCIEIDHDSVEPDRLATTIRQHLHGTEMYASEMMMVAVEPLPGAPACDHHRAEQASAQHSPEQRSKPTNTDRSAASVDATMTLGDIVTSYPQLAVEFERVDLDYCCHGDRSLESAAIEAGLDPQGLVEQLSERLRTTDVVAPMPSDLRSLVADIESVHHRYLWEEMPRITGLVDKIHDVHGERHPELAEVQRLWVALRSDLEPHLVAEEERLFPAIRRIDASGGGPVVGTDGLTQLMDQIETEHDEVGSLLEQLRAVTSDYTTPADGCATYTACYAALSAVASDIHVHVHKENNLLMPMLRDTLAQ